MNNLIEILKEAMNVYRTKNYIVKQNFFIEYDQSGESRIHSDDIYILRNKKLDKAFYNMFSSREYLDGKRVHTATYIRRYIK